MKIFPQCEGDREDGRPCQNKATATRTETYMDVDGRQRERSVRLCTGCVKQWDKRPLVKAGAM